MDLLKYMRSQDNMAQANGSALRRGQGSLVLLAGSSRASKKERIRTLALLHCVCGLPTAHTGDGRIVCSVSDEEHDAGESSMASVGRRCTASKARGFRTRFRGRDRLPHRTNFDRRVLEEEAPCRTGRSWLTIASQ